MVEVTGRDEGAGWEQEALKQVQGTGQVTVMTPGICGSEKSFVARASCPCKILHGQDAHATIRKDPA